MTSLHSLEPAAEANPRYFSRRSLPNNNSTSPPLSSSIIRSLRVEEAPRAVLTTNQIITEQEVATLHRITIPRDEVAAEAAADTSSVEEEATTSRKTNSRIKYLGTSLLA